MKSSSLCLFSSLVFVVAVNIGWLPCAFATGKNEAAVTNSPHSKKKKPTETTAPNLTQHERQVVEEGRRVLKEAAKAPPFSEHMRDKMQSTHGEPTKAPKNKP